MELRKEFAIVWDSLKSLYKIRFFVAVSNINYKLILCFYIQFNYAKYNIWDRFDTNHSWFDSLWNWIFEQEQNLEISLRSHPPSRSIPIIDETTRCTTRNTSLLDRTSLSLKISNKFLSARRWWIVPILSVGEKKKKRSRNQTLPSKTTIGAHSACDRSIDRSIDGQTDGWIMMNGIGFVATRFHGTTMVD